MKVTQIKSLLVAVIVRCCSPRRVRHAAYAPPGWTSGRVYS
jgi:hypothetical protein